MKLNDRVNCETCVNFGLDNLMDGGYSPCDDCEYCSNWEGVARAERLIDRVITNAIQRP